MGHVAEMDDIAHPLVELRDFILMCGLHSEGLDVVALQPCPQAFHRQDFVAAGHQRVGGRTVFRLGQ